MKRIITSIIVAGIVIYTSVIFEQSFYLIGIPICAIIGGSAYLSKRKMQTGDLIRYSEKRASSFDREVARLIGLKDGDIITLEVHHGSLLSVETPTMSKCAFASMNKKSFVLID